VRPRDWDRFSAPEGTMHAGISRERHAMGYHKRMTRYTNEEIRQAGGQAGRQPLNTLHSNVTKACKQTHVTIPIPSKTAGLPHENGFLQVEYYACRTNGINRLRRFGSPARAMRV